MATCVILQIWGCLPAAFQLPRSQYCQQASKSGRSEKPRLQISGRIMHAASSRELRAAQSCFRGLSRQPQNTYICRVAVEELGQLSLGIASTRIESLRKDVKAIDHHVRPVCILYVCICKSAQAFPTNAYISHSHIYGACGRPSFFVCM